MGFAIHMYELSLLELLLSDKTHWSVHVKVIINSLCHKVFVNLFYRMATFLFCIYCIFFLWGKWFLVNIVMLLDGLTRIHI